MKRLSILVALVAALGACAGEAPQFESIDALSAAADQAGVCSDPEAGGAAELVEASVRCVDSGVALYLFDDERDLQRWTEIAARLDPTVVGPNWAASGPQDGIDRVAEALDAEAELP